MSAVPTEAPPLIFTSRGVEVRQPHGDDGSRWYVDPDDPDTLLQSVTNAISACSSKPWLTTWAAKLAAEAAVEEHALIDAMLAPRDGDDALSPADLVARRAERVAGAVDYLKGAAKRRREQASTRGTWVHDVVEALVLDTALPDLPDDVKPYVDQFIEWWAAFDPVPFMSEATVCNRARGYAGTLDLGVHLPSLAVSAVIDVKSGANIDASMPVQLAAYRQAREVWLPFGRKAAMPRTDRAYVLHLTPTSYKLIDVTDESGEAYRQFLFMLEQIAWRDRQGGRVGTVIYPPLEDGSQPSPLLEDVDGVPAVGKLRAMGVERLDDLCALTAAELLTIPGVGPGSLRALVPLLARFGKQVEGLSEELDRLDAEARAAEQRRVALAEQRIAKHAAGAHAAKPVRGCPSCAAAAPLAAVDA